MSAVRIAGIRRTARQFAAALLLCTAVAAGAAVATAPHAATASSQAVAVGADNDWPNVTPAPTN